jgi:crossover junction endodeoxyribonuclease RusA
MEIVFPVPGPAVTANSRQHWAVKRRALAPWTAALTAAWIEAGCPRDLGPSTVTITFGVRDRRRRDPSNLMPTQKRLIDDLVKLGVWPDDCPAFVTEAMPSVEVSPVVRIVITPR